jgi:cytochrome c-type biogenesis protein CcmH/NrfG
LELRDRGEYREGIMRLREAVRFNPRWPEAFAEMGDMLYHIGDLDRALNAYELALREQPLMRAALRGAAVIYQQKKDHSSAARYLRMILRSNANDAEVWMNLGDIAIYQGDEVLARECYTRATRTDSSATQVIDDARKRLRLMDDVSRRYRQDG